MPTALEKVVKIIFAGEDTGLSKTINSVGKGLDGMSTKVKDATQPLADLSDLIVKTNLVLGGLAIGGLVVATKAAGDFGDSFNEISTLIKAPDEAIAEFRKNVLGYATDSKASFGEITAATYQIISATGDWENSLDLLTQAERLNVAGKGELDATTKLLATSLNAYGKDVDSAADFSDILFTTVKVGVTNLTELGGSLGTVTGLASSAGVPFLDLNAAIGALTGTVGDTSLATTQLKGILTAIVKPSKQAADEAARLGIEFNTQALSALGLEKFLKLVFTATEGNSESMAKLFGRVEGLNGALILGADTSGKYADALKAMEARTGAVTVAYDKMAENFKLNNQKIINSLTATLVTVGTPLLDDWGDLAAGIAETFKGLKVGFDQGAFDGLIDVVENLAQDLATLFTGIGESLPEALKGVDFTDFETALQELVDTGKALLNNLFGGLDLTKPEDLEKAIQKVVDTFETWVDLTKGLVQGLAPFIEKIGEMASKFSDLDGDTASLIGQITGFGKAINVIAGVLPNLTGPINALSTSIALLSLTRMPAFIASLVPFTAFLKGITVVAAPFLALIATFEALKPDTGLGKWLKENSTAFKFFSESIDKTILTLGGYNIKTVEAAEKQAANTVELGKEAVALVKVREELGLIAKIPPTDVEIDLALDEFYEDIDAFTSILSDIQNAPTTEIEIGVEDTAVKTFESDWGKIKVELEDGTVLFIDAEGEKAVTEAKDTKEKVDKELQDKILLVTLQGEIDIELANIKAQAETLQTAFEWNAKIEIANVEAEVERLEIAAGLLGKAWESTGDVISAAFGALAGVHGLNALEIRKALERELDLRERIADETIKLTQAQVELTIARTKALQTGKGLITIQADGIEPELNLVLRKIIELAQIEATEEGFGLLLGI